MFEIVLPYIFLGCSSFVEMIHGITASGFSLDLQRRSRSRRWCWTSLSIDLLNDLKRTSVDNFSPAMGARDQVGIGLSYRPVSPCSVATQFQTRFLETIPRPIAGLKFSTQASSPSNDLAPLLTSPPPPPPLPSVARPATHRSLRKRDIWLTGGWKGGP